MGRLSVMPVGVSGTLVQLTCTGPTRFLCRGQTLGGTVAVKVLLTSSGDFGTGHDVHGFRGWVGMVEVGGTGTDGVGGITRPSGPRMRGWPPPRAVPSRLHVGSAWGQGPRPYVALYGPLPVGPITPTGSCAGGPQGRKWLRPRHRNAGAPLSLRVRSLEPRRAECGRAGERVGATWVSHRGVVACPCSGSHTRAAMRSRTSASAWSILPFSELIMLRSARSAP